MASKGHSRSLMVAAIDFGTTCSGYAFSTVQDFEKDPTHVRINSWTSRDSISLKTPTCVLFDPNKEFNSFGFEAEDRYTDLSYEENHKEWYIFRRFKMELYGSKSINRKPMLTDECGKEMPAIDVFAAGIKFFKDRLLRECRHFGEIREDDIKWVLTVPAIWDDSAKQFMREAAEEGGIPGHRLVLALEAVAASVYCMNLPVERLVGSAGQVSCFQPGSRFMVVDAGGVTIDVIVYEIMPGGELKEIYKAIGGPWGGTTVDNEYIAYLRDIVHGAVMDEFKDRNKDEYMDLLRYFEVRKRTVKPDVDQKVLIRIPMGLQDIYRDIKHKELCDNVRQDPELREKVVFSKDKLRVAPEVMVSFFKSASDNIVKHLRSILQQPDVKGTSSILMVGGFSESPMIQHAVYQAFQNMRVIIPDDAGLAVLKGAVIFGHNREIPAVSERVFRYTYGVETIDTLNPEKHDKSRLNDKHGRKEAAGIFSKIAEVGQSVIMNVGSEFHFYHTPKCNTGFSVKIYASPKENPQYVDEEGCMKVGEVHVGCRDNCRNPDGTFVSMVIAGTELEILARH